MFGLTIIWDLKSHDDDEIDHLNPPASFWPSDQLLLLSAHPVFFFIIIIIPSSLPLTPHCHAPCRSSVPEPHSAEEEEAADVVQQAADL